MTILKRLLRDASGASMVEYGLLMALLATAIIAGGNLFGSNLSDVYATVGGVVKDAVAAAGIAGDGPGPGNAEGN